MSGVLTDIEVDAWGDQSVPEAVPLTGDSLIRDLDAMGRRVKNVCNDTPNEVWVTPLSRGGIGGKGTQIDPIDGSTQANFQAVLDGLAANGTIHVAPGTFVAYVLSISKSVRITGCSASSVFTQAVGANNPIFVVSGSSTQFTLENLTLDHGSTYREEANFYAILNSIACDRITLRNVLSKDFHTTVANIGTANRITLDRSEFQYTYGRASISNLSPYTDPVAVIVGSPKELIVIDSTMDGQVNSSFSGVTGSPPLSQQVAADNFVQTGNHDYALIQGNTVRHYGIEALYLARTSPIGVYSYTITGNSTSDPRPGAANAYAPGVSLLNCQATVTANTISNTPIAVKALFTNTDDTNNVVHIDGNHFQHVVIGVQGVKLSTKSTLNGNDIWNTSEPSRTVYGQACVPCEFYGLAIDHGDAGGNHITADEPVWDATTTLTSRASNVFTVASTAGITVGGVLVSYGGGYGVAYFPVTAVNPGAGTVTVDAGWAGTYSAVTSGTLNFQATAANFSSTGGIVVVTGGNVNADGNIITGYQRDLSQQNSGTISVDRHTARNNHIAQSDSATFKFKTRRGTATLSSGSVVVSSATVTTSSLIRLTGQGQGSNIGFIYEDQPSRVAGTSFKIKSSNASDTQTVVWEITEP